MVDLLKRSLAPIADEAWAQIDKTAVEILTATLTARTLVDFSGPHGWSLAAVNVGRLNVGQEPGPKGVHWGLRQTLPLIETRVQFQLGQWELDNASRGAKDLELGPLEEAARNIAFFEESTIYNGFEPGCVRGILQRAAHEPLPLPANAAEYPGAVAQGVKRLRLVGVGGPYALVLGPEPFAALIQAGQAGFPPYDLIREILEGDVLMSPALEGGVLLSRRGGDFQLTVGQDISIGFQHHHHEHPAQVELFLTESFTFQVLMPIAALELRRTG